MGLINPPVHGDWSFLTDHSLKILAALVLLKLIFVLSLTQEQRIRRLLSSRRRSIDPEMGEMQSIRSKRIIAPDQRSTYTIASLPSLSSGLSSSSESPFDNESDSDDSSHLCYIVSQNYLSTSTRV